MYIGFSPSRCKRICAIGSGKRSLNTKWGHSSKHDARTTTQRINPTAMLEIMRSAKLETKQQKA
jgi:hypothetical protein